MLDKLTAKLGPLPVWVWGLIIGGILVAWQWRSRMGGSSSSDTAEEEAALATVAPYGNFSTVPMATAPADVSNVEQTNQEWLNVAMKAIQANNMGSSLSAQTALEKYLSGRELTAAEAKIVDYAIKAAGLPPQGVQEIPSVTPTPNPPSVPSVRYVKFSEQGTVYRVESDGSLTPYSHQTWQTFRMTPLGAGIGVSLLTGNSLAAAKAARKNPMI